jgi:hypothetical protein
MKRLARVLIGGAFAAAFFSSEAEPVCRQVTVQAMVETAREKLTLQDLLAPDSCAQMRQAAAEVPLGLAPRGGIVRVLDGQEVRRQLEGLKDGHLGLGKNVELKIPERILIRRAGAMKSCAEIARFVASAASAPDPSAGSNRWQEKLDCAAAQGIPEDTQLALTRTTWNAGLQRWEFALRCAQPEECVPFLAWVSEERRPPAMTADAHASAVRRPASWDKTSARGVLQPLKSVPWLVKRGQTATLLWEQSGIRVTLPVTCLDAGGLGDVVRVRFKNAARTLQAEVVGEKALRVKL